MRRHRDGRKKKSGSADPWSAETIRPHSPNIRRPWVGATKAVPPRQHAALRLLTLPLLQKSRRRAQPGIHQRTAQRQRRYLMGLGVNVGQGFLFAPGLTPEEFVRKLK